MKHSRIMAATAVFALMAGAASAENVLRWSSQGDALTMDPHSQNEGPTIAMNGQIYESLVTRDAALTLSPELAETFGIQPGTPAAGVIITGVLQAAPAAKAGMLPGDVIVQVGDHQVLNVAEMMTAVAALQPGVSAPITVQRGAERLTLDVIPSVRPTPPRARQQR